MDHAYANRYAEPTDSHPPYRNRRFSYSQYPLDHQDSGQRQQPMPEGYDNNQEGLMDIPRHMRSFTPRSIGVHSTRENPCRYLQSDWFTKRNNGRIWHLCSRCNPEVTPLTDRTWVTCLPFKDPVTEVFPVEIMAHPPTPQDPWYSDFFVMPPNRHMLPVKYADADQLQFCVMMHGHNFILHCRETGFLDDTFIQQRVLEELQLEFLAHQIYITPLELQVYIRNESNTPQFTPVNKYTLDAKTHLTGFHCHKFIVPLRLTAFRAWTKLQVVAYRITNKIPLSTSTPCKIVEHMVRLPVSPQPLPRSQPVASQPTISTSANPEVPRTSTHMQPVTTTPATSAEAQLHTIPRDEEIPNFHHYDGIQFMTTCPGTPLSILRHFTPWDIKHLKLHSSMGNLIRIHKKGLEFVATYPVVLTNLDPIIAGLSASALEKLKDRIHSGQDTPFFNIVGRYLQQPTVPIHPIEQEINRRCSITRPGTAPPSQLLEDDSDTDEDGQHNSQKGSQNQHQDRVSLSDGRPTTLHQQPPDYLSTEDKRQYTKYVTSVSKGTAISRGSSPARLLSALTSQDRQDLLEHRRDHLLNQQSPPRRPETPFTPYPQLPTPMHHDQLQNPPALPEDQDL